MRIYGVRQCNWEKVELPKVKEKEINYKELNKSIAQSAKERGLTS